MPLGVVGSQLSIIAQEGPLTRIWGWSIVLVFLMLGLFVAIWWARRRVADAEREGAQSFTLSDLRAMRDAGQITPEQFEKLKQRIFEAARTPGAPAGGRPRDV